MQNRIKLLTLIFCLPSTAIFSVTDRKATISNPYNMPSNLFIFAPNPHNSLPIDDKIISEPKKPTFKPHYAILGLTLGTGAAIGWWSYKKFLVSKSSRRAVMYK